MDTGNLHRRGGADEHHQRVAPQPLPGLPHRRRIIERGDADAQQEAAGVPAAYPEYTERLTALRDLVATRPPEDWGSTVYDAWLYAILPMWLGHGVEFPDYMQTEAWAARAHQAGFGSYTALMKR